MCKKFYSEEEARAFIAAIKNITRLLITALLSSLEKELISGPVMMGAQRNVPMLGVLENYDLTNLYCDGALAILAVLN